MLNNQILNNSNLNIFQNKYFFILCLYLKNKTNSDFISEWLFIGYKYNYLILNINTLIKLCCNLLKKELLCVILTYKKFISIPVIIILSTWNRM